MYDTMNIIICTARETDPTYQLCHVFSAIAAESGPIPALDDHPWGSTEVPDSRIKSDAPSSFPLIHCQL